MIITSPFIERCHRFDPCPRPVARRIAPPTVVTVPSVGSEETPDHVESGTVALAIGQSAVEVVFATTKSSSDYDIDVMLKNAADPNPGVWDYIIKAQTPSGFTLLGSGSPDTVNYAMRWRVKVR